MASSTQRTVLGKRIRVNRFKIAPNTEGNLEFGLQQTDNMERVLNTRGPPREMFTSRLDHQPIFQGAKMKMIGIILALLVLVCIVTAALLTWNILRTEKVISDLGLRMDQLTEKVDTTHNRMTINTGKLQTDVKAHDDAISRLEDGSRTCSRDITNLQVEVKEQKEDIEELERKYLNLTGMVLSLDCQDILTKHGTARSGVFRIYPTSNSTAYFLSVYCDMTTQGGGWIVIQRRQDGTVDFYRDWQDYKRGFGSLNSEFWLGLENIHALVADGDWELLINMRDDVKGERYARFNTFSVGPESKGYTLTVGGYSGDAGDSLDYHNGRKFSTKDKDNDVDVRNCAEVHTGAWWYKNCHQSNLNGVYGSENYKGPRWHAFTGEYPVEFVEMKIRQKK